MLVSEKQGALSGHSAGRRQEKEDRHLFNVAQTGLTYIKPDLLETLWNRY